MVNITETDGKQIVPSFQNASINPNLMRWRWGIPRLMENPVYLFELFYFYRDRNSESKFDFGHFWSSSLFRVKFFLHMITNRLAAGGSRGARAKRTVAAATAGSLNSPGCSARVWCSDGKYLSVICKWMIRYSSSAIIRELFGDRFGGYVRYLLYRRSSKFHAWNLSDRG